MLGIGWGVPKPIEGTQDCVTAVCDFDLPFVPVAVCVASVEEVEEAGLDAPPVIAPAAMQANAWASGVICIDSVGILAAVALEADIGLEAAGASEDVAAAMGAAADFAAGAMAIAGTAAVGPLVIVPLTLLPSSETCFPPKFA
jgi:hypothetical protein